MAVALEDPEGVALVEVLPLHDRMREDLGHARDEGLDELVVGRTRDAARAVPEIERVFEKRGVVGADVEADGQHLGWVDAGARDVERQLADGDAHATRTLVSEAEDALVVGDDDEADVVVGVVPEPLGDAVDVVGREPDASHVAHDVAEALARLSDGGRVDDRHQLGQMLDQHPVEEDLVAIQERREPDVALQVGALLVQVLELELHLLLDRLDRRGQAGRAGRTARAPPA